MAVLFLSGCASATKPEAAASAASQIAMAKTKIQAARSARAEDREKLFVETEKSLDSAACSISELTKLLGKTEKKADEMAKSTDFWRKKHSEAVSKLNSWRFSFFAGLSVILSIALAAFSVSRIKPLKIF
jgi:hypothetical protein